MFKQRGRVRGSALVYPAFAGAEPGCLITNAPALSVHDYALHNWQEQSFRDLKSGGWHSQQSQVWQPAHAQVLVLVLAYAWVVSLGTLGAHAEPAVRARITRGTGRLTSIFREGLRFGLDLIGSHHPSIWAYFSPQINS